MEGFFIKVISVFIPSSMFYFEVELQKAHSILLKCMLHAEIIGQKRNYTLRLYQSVAENHVPCMLSS